jgi:uncharacterized protein
VVLAARYVLRLPGCRTLKDKRARLRPLVDRVRNRHVSVAEIGAQDVHDRAELELAVVAPTPSRAQHLLTELDRLVWAAADVEIVTVTRAWVEGLDD